jgi:6-phosphogluconolactonase
VTAEHLVDAARRGGHVGVSGGGTPRAAYELAARLEPDWSEAELWWVDDRCVPPDHEYSNFRAVEETLLSRLDIQPKTVHRIHGELPPEEAAARYDGELGGVVLDLAVMGLGPDGHTASLFPHAPELQEAERLAVPAEAKLEPFVPRVTTTIPFLARSRLMLYLVSGEERAAAVARAFGGEADPGTPASLVRGFRTIAVLDKAAGSRI